MDFEAEALLLRRVDTEFQDLGATDYDAEALLLRQIIFDSPPCTLRRFGKLPWEIRTKIWTLTALNVVRVKEVFNNAKGRMALRRPVPTVLQVCKESRFNLTYDNNGPPARKDLDKYYLLYGEWEKEPHRVYVSWKRDEIYLARPGRKLSGISSASRLFQTNLFKCGHPSRTIQALGRTSASLSWTGVCRASGGTT